MTRGSTAGVTHGITEVTGEDGMTHGITGDIGDGTTLGIMEYTGVDGTLIMPVGMADSVLIGDTTIITVVRAMGMADISTTVGMVQDMRLSLTEEFSQMPSGRLSEEA